MRSRFIIGACLAALGCTPSIQPVAGGAGGGGLAGGSDGAAGAPGAGGPAPERLPDAGSPNDVPPGPSCAQEAHAAERLPVDLLLLVDVSASMDELSGSQTKWEKSRAALGAFVRDPGSAGLGVGLSFFPSKTPEELRACMQDGDCAGVSTPLERSCRGTGWCFAPGLPLLTNRPCAPGIVTPFNCPGGLTCKPQGRCAQSGGPCVEGSACPGAGERCNITPGTCRILGEGCNVAKFGQLDVDIGDLPGRADGIVAALAAQTPDGATPMALAADSALTALEARQRAMPQRRSVLVLATDGQPSGCGDGQSVDAVVARLQRSRAGAPSIPTYVVGVFAPDEIAQAQAALDRFAVAGGTRTPFILATGDDLSQRLLAALTEIRKQSVACEYTIPRPTMGSLDFDRVNVRTSGAAGREEPAYVTSADRCPADRGGWYYDTPPSGTAMPSRLVLCPSTCARLRDDPTARVELVFGCATVVIK